MKNYSSNRAQKGKTAYRTPSLFKANKAMYYAKLKGGMGKNAKFNPTPYPSPNRGGTKGGGL